MWEHQEETTGTGRRELLFAAMFALVAINSVIDLVYDRSEPRPTGHLIAEAIIATTSLGLALSLWYQWRQTARRLQEAKRTLTDQRSEQLAWQARAERALLGMRQAIEEQFTAWGLTASEREVSLLLLQGLGHKQIAAQTHRSERTVRQHAVAAYEKSGLGGRAELAAFFLQGLIAPSLPQPSDDSPPPSQQNFQDI